MSEQQHDCISDGEEDPEESQIAVPIVVGDNDADIRKNLFDEFDVATKQKTYSDNSSSGREYMKVYLRIRPFSNEEIEAKEDQNCVEKESPNAVLMNAPKESFAFKNSTRAGSEISHRFSFSNVFNEDTTQKKFFDETTLPLVADFIHGQNCLVFTYGVTNSGKTYTIQGTPKDGGILPRSLDVLFNSIEGKNYTKMNLKPRFCTDVIRLTEEEEHRESSYKNALLSSLDKDAFDINALLKLDQDLSSDVSKANCTEESMLHNTIKSQDGDIEHELTSVDSGENDSRVVDDTTIDVEAQGPVKFSVWVSLAEIYNEIIYDLLEPCPMGKGKKRTTLRLGDDTNGNPYIKGLREIYVSNADEAYKILKIGQKNQRIASTKLNQCSSRSHCIFSVKVLRVVDVEDPHVARVSRLSFVDLAGSERYSKTHSKGDRLKEAGNINTSLMTLGKCLEYLRYNQKNPSQPLIIPFRESKLTRLFQGFFCGKGRASMIVNVNMCASMFDETFHVMKFSAIAKKVTTRVTKPVDMPPPAKKLRGAFATPRPKPTRLSVPWDNGALCTPAPPVEDSLAEINEENDDEEVENGEHHASAYQQQLVNLVKALQEKLIDEKRKMQILEVKIREEVCKEMAEQLVSIENAYSERVKMEVTAVEEKCDRRIELLTQSIKKTRKRARIERIEEDDEEWVPSVFLHAEQTKVQEKQHIISELNAKIAELRQEVKQLKESRQEETSKSDAVLELQGHLNDANEEVNELKQMLEEAGEAFTEKEAEINKLRAALDEQETCFKNQDEALRHLTKELENAKRTSKPAENVEELHQLKGALEAATIKLAETGKNLEAKDRMLREVVRTLEETREELARERSYVAQAFDNDEELIRVKDELLKAEAKTADLEKRAASKDEDINSLKREIEDARARHVKKTAQDEENGKVLSKKMVEIEKANNKVAALAKQLEDVKEENRRTKEELEKLTAESTEKDSQLELAKNEIKEKTSQLEDATREIFDHSAAVEGMTKQFIEMESELQSVKEDNLKKGEELERVLEEKLEILAKHKSDDHQTRVTDRSVVGSDSEAVKQAARVRALEEGLREKSLELENVKSDYTRKIGELETELSGCKTEIRKLRSEDAIKELEQQLEESTKALDKKNSQVIARNNTIKRLELSLAEKEKFLSEMEKLPKEPNLRAKEELKTLRRRLVQAGKELEEIKELLAVKERKMDDTRQELEKIKSENDEKAAAYLKDLQAARTELSEVKESAEKKQEEIEALKGQLDAQRLKNACVQTQLENEKRCLLEKENAVQAAKKELNTIRSKSSTEIDDAKKRLESTEEKVQQLEDEVFTVNEESSRVQAEVQRYQKEIVPGLENKIKALEDENQRSSLKVKDTEEIMEKNLSEARCQLKKRNSELEQRMKELNDLRDSLKTAEKEKFEELDKYLQEMMSMQKTIEERNRSLDALEEKLRDSNLELEKSKERTKSLNDQLESLNQEKRSLEERLEALTKKLELLTSDSGKEKETLSSLKLVLQEQDLIMTGQAQAIDERQSEIETLSSELQTLQEKCSFAEKELEKKKSEIANLKQQASTASEERKRFEQKEVEINKLKEDHSSLEAQLKAKDEEIKNVNDSRDNIMKTMREALDVAKANKAECDVKLATVREQCRNEMKREMEEEKRKMKRDFQRQLDEKDRSLEEIKCEKESVEKAIAAVRAERSKTGSSSSDPETQTENTDVPASDSEVKSSVLRSNQKRNLKRNSSDLTLAELKNQLSASKSRKKEDSDEEFTPGSVRKTRTRSSARKAGRSNSTRCKRATPVTVDVLPTKDEKDCKTESEREKQKLFNNIQESASSTGEENVPPNQPSQQPSKKRGKLFHKPSSLTALLSSGKNESRDDKSEQPDKTKSIITRQLRPRAIKYN